MFDEKLITESRLSSALKKELTPLHISRETAVAIFAGSGGKAYETSLDHCACPDFAIQGFSQPCKHMIRLAMEVGKIPSDGMQTDIDAARGKFISGKIKEFIKYAKTDEFIPFAVNFMRLSFYQKPVKDDAFAESLDAETLTDIPFFKYKKDGTATVKKEWRKEIENITTAISTRFGKEIMDSVMYDDTLMAMICKEGE